MTLDSKSVQTMPTVNENKPSAAAMGPAHDLLARLQPRLHQSSGEE
jgi:hypothetical protein